MAENLRDADPYEAREINGYLSRGQIHEVYVAGARLKGSFDVVAREGNDIAWEVHQDNLLTDYGRQYLAMYLGLDTNCSMGTSPIADTPVVQRCALCSYAQFDNNFQASIAHSFDSPSQSKTWTYNSYAAGARSIACVYISPHQQQDGSSGSTRYSGIFGIVAYSLITPVRQQTASQTLELSYKLTLSIVT
jgi:hypothetical protein